MCYFTWYNLSVIQEVLEIRGYPDGVRLLNNFKHQFDCTRPFTKHPIPDPDVDQVDPHVDKASPDSKKVSTDTW